MGLCAAVTGAVEGAMLMRGRKEEALLGQCLTVAKGDGNFGHDTGPTSGASSLE